MDDSSSDPALIELRRAAVSFWRDANLARLEMLQTYAEIDRTGVASLQLRGIADLIGLELRCTRRYANGVVRDMRRYAGRVSMSGEALEPMFPLIASGLRDGLFSFEHASVIAKCVETLSPELLAEYRAAIEEALVERAVECDPISLRTLADRIVALLDQDGPEPKDEVRYRQRELRFTVLPDGSSIITGRLTATATAAWSVIFSALAKTRNVDVTDEGELVHGDDELGKDPRTEPQWFHDALEEAGRLLLETGKLPDHAGLKADLIVTIDLHDLETRTGRATTHHGGTLTTQQLLHLAADLNVIHAILDQELGLVTDSFCSSRERSSQAPLRSAGRGRRLASPIQRKVIFARDRGCTFPGCDRSAGQSQVHHMDEWLVDAGETNPDNLTLTCGYHNNEAPRQGGKPNSSKAFRTGHHPPGATLNRNPDATGSTIPSS